MSFVVAGRGVTRPIRSVHDHDRGLRDAAARRIEDGATEGSSPRVLAAARGIARVVINAMAVKRTEVRVGDMGSPLCSRSARRDVPTGVNRTRSGKAAEKDRRARSTGARPGDFSAALGETTICIAFERNSICDSEHICLNCSRSGNVSTSTPEILQRTASESRTLTPNCALVVFSISF